MLTNIQMIAMAQANKARLKRILAEIDAPRKARLEEARLSFVDYIAQANLVKEN